MIINIIIIIIIIIIINNYNYDYYNYNYDNYYNDFCQIIGTVYRGSLPNQNFGTLVSMTNSTPPRMGC